MIPKETLRKELRSRLSSQEDGDRLLKSALIQRKLFFWERFRKARCVLFFVSLPTEVNTRPMIEAALDEGKRVIVPRCVLSSKKLELYEIKALSELKPGTLGILEPDPAVSAPARAEDIDCAVVPGLGFDGQGNRLGRGAGFYDRFLKTLKPGTPTVGLGFSFQVISKIPVESFDVPLDKILTEEGKS